MSVFEGHRKATIAAKYTNLVMAESTRHGGVSTGAYRSLNLGIYTQDNPEDIQKNRQLFCESLGFTLDRLAASHQIHEDKIAVIAQPGNYEGYDALITNLPNTFVSVTIADCTPILIYDPVTKACAAIHAGWRGTVQEIVTKTVKKLTEHYHTIPSDCIAYIGTCIDQCSFEVGEEVAKNFALNFIIEAPNNKYLVDLKAANKQQLLAAGIPDNQIEVSIYSTFANNNDYFSHRYEKGITGRMLAVIGTH